MTTSHENCQEIQELLSAYVDGEANPEETARVAAHVEGCFACASHLAFLRTAAAAWRRIPMEMPSPRLAERIAQATYARPRFRDRVLEALRPLPTRLALGTALGAGIVSVFVMQRVGTPPEAPVVAAGTVGRPLQNDAGEETAPSPAVAGSESAKARPSSPMPRKESKEITVAQAPTKKTRPAAGPELPRSRSGIVLAVGASRISHRMSARPAGVSEGVRIAVPETGLAARSQREERTLTTSDPEPLAPSTTSERTVAPADSRPTLVASLSPDESDPGSGAEETSGTSGKISWKEFARSGNEPLRALRGVPVPRPADGSRVSVVDAPVTTQTH